MTPFQSLRDYEEFIYTLKNLNPVIKSSTLVVIQRGKRMAILQGDVTFPTERLSSWTLMDKGRTYTRNV